MAGTEDFDSFMEEPPEEKKKKKKKEENSNKTEHSPFKAFVSSIVETPADIITLGGLAKSAIEAGYNRLTDDTQSFSEHFEDKLKKSSTVKLGSDLSEKIKGFFGVPEWEDMNTAERVATFAPALIPSKAVTKGTTLITPNVIKNISKDYITKKTQKKYKDLLQKELQTLPKEATKAEKLNLLKEANTKPLKFDKNFLYKTSEEVAELAPEIQKSLKSVRPLIDSVPKTLNVSDVLNPFMSVTSKEKLIYANLKKGMTPQQAINTATKQQLISFGTQATIPYTFGEGIAALTDSQGIFNNYTKQQDIVDDLEKENNNKILKNLSAVGAAVFGSVLGYKAYKYKNSDRIGKLKTSNELNKEMIEAGKALIPDETRQMQNDVVTNFSDKNAFMHNPAFKDIVKFDKDNIISYTEMDIPSIVDNNWKSNDFGFNIKTNITPEQHYKDLINLAQKDPQSYNKVEAFIDSLADFQNAEDTYYKSFMKDPETHNINFKNLSTRDRTQFFKENTSKLEVIKEMKKELLENPATKKILEDHSELSKALLDYSHNTGLLSDNVYDYLKSNRSVDGYFSYKSLIHEDKRSLLDKINDFLFNNSKKDPRIRDTFESRIGILDQRKSYLDAFPIYFQKTFTDALHNTRKKNVLHSLLEGNKKFIAQQETGFLKDFTSKYNKLMNFKGSVTPDEVLELSDSAIKKLSDASRIEYLGKTIAQSDKQSTIKFSKNPYDILNKNDADSAKSVKAFISKYSRDPERSQYRFEKQVNNAKLDRNIISYVDGDETYYFRVSPMIKKSLEVSPEIANNIGQALIKSKKVMQKFTTGNLNPSFSVTSYLYGLQEGLAALKTASKEANIPYYRGLSEMHYTLSTLKAARDYYKINTSKRLIKNLTNQLYNKELGLNVDKNFDKISPQLKVLQANIDNALLTRMKRVGAMVFNDPNDLTNDFVTLLPKNELSGKALDKIKNIYGDVRGSRVISTVQFIQEALRNAANIGMVYHLAGEKAMKNDKQLRNLAHIVSSVLTDSKKSGNYEGLLGTLVGGIAKYTPYGNVMVQSLAAKLHNSGIKNLPTQLKAMYKTVEKSDRRLYDALNELIIGVEALGNNSYIQGLITTAAIPAIIAYLWNNSNQSNRDNYYRINDYDKGSKLIMTNMFGEGNHFAIPIDQEVMVVQKLTEAILDTFLGGSSYNKIDPAYKNTPVVMQSLARSLGIQDVIYPEVMLNIAGYKSNLDPENLLSGDTISPIGYNQINLDGSQTSLMNGILTNQTKTLINTLFGSLATTLSNGIEQAHIGTRDNNLGQGFKDFVSSTTRSFFKNNPLYAFDDKFNYRAANQTYNYIKSVKNVRTKLAQLSSLYKTITDPDKDLVRRKSVNLFREAQLTTDTSKFEQNLELVQDVIKGFDKNVANLYDKISGIYKQINIYKSSGKDLDGNVITEQDRNDYMRKKNLEIQDISAEIYTKIKDLENVLTKKYNRAINLNDIKTIIGE